MYTLSKITTPLRLAYTLLRRSILSVSAWKPQKEVRSQASRARLVDQSVLHRIRAGRIHRFIDILLVTVDDRVFCRRYTYAERSWRDVFLRDPDGQVALDNVVVDVESRVPRDLDSINTRVNAAYERALRRIGAGWMFKGAIDDRAMASTMEIHFVAQR